MVGLGAELQEVEGEMNRLDDVLKYPIEQEAESKPEENPGEDTEKELPIPGKIRGICRA